MSGTDYRIPLAAVHQAHREHMAGWSLRALARMRYQEWGYKSAKSALEGLRRAMRTLDLPVRDRITATVDVSTVHGLSTRAARDPQHPDHAAHLAHRRHLRATRTRTETA